MNYSDLSEEELSGVISTLKQDIDPEYYQEEPEPEKPIIIPALAGAGQGLTSGFADELVGAAGYIAGKLPGVDTDYTQSRDAAREYFRQQQAANPEAFMAGDIAGGVAQAFIPGVGQFGTISKGAQGAKLAGEALLKGGVLGAVEGLGRSEGENLSEIAKDTTLGGIGGALTGGVLQGGISGIKAAAKIPLSIKNRVMSKFAPDNTTQTQGFIEKNILETGMGLSKPEQAAIIKNPELVKEMQKIKPEQIVNETLKLYNNAQKAIIQKSKEANQKLSSVPQPNSMTRDQLFSEIDNLAIQASQSGSAKGTSGGYQNELQNLKEFIASKHPENTPLPETELKNIMSDVRSNVKNWSKLSGSPLTEEASRDVSTILNNKLNQNTEYKEAMKPVRELADDLGRFEKTFPMEQAFDADRNAFYRFKDEDQILNKLKKFENKEEITKRVSELESSQIKNAPELSEQTPFTERLNYYNLAKGTETGAPMGSANVNMYSDVGRLVGALGMGAAGYGVTEDPAVALLAGGVGGQAAAAPIGRFIDRHGRSLAKEYLLKKYGSSISSTSKGIPDLLRFSGTKFENILRNAAQRGLDNLATTDYILSQRQDYREIKNGK